MWAASPANNKTGILFGYSSATKLTRDIKFYNENYTKLEQNLKLTQSEVSILQKQKELSAQEVAGLKQDKSDYSTAAETYKSQLVQCTTDLNKERDSKPSRWVWFSAGFVTGLILVIAGALVLK